MPFDEIICGTAYYCAPEAPKRFFTRLIRSKRDTQPIFPKRHNRDNRDNRHNRDNKDNRDNRDNRHNRDNR